MWTGNRNSDHLRFCGIIHAIEWLESSCRFVSALLSTYQISEDYSGQFD
jgi:hypothetical protein